MSQIIIREKHRGQTVTVPVESRVTIRLPENPSNGYHWVFEKIESDFLRILKHDFETSKNASIGSAGQRIIKIQPYKTGNYDLKLVYKRNWEDKYKDEFNINLVIE